jgi:hypothetical protein
MRPTSDLSEVGRFNLKTDCVIRPARRVTRFASYPDSTLASGGISA